jgi:hypothetical protein
MVFDQYKHLKKLGKPLINVKELSEKYNFSERDSP